MAVQTYIREEIRTRIYQNFKNTYRQLLTDTYKDETKVKQVLDDNKELFDKIVQITFKDDPCEKYLREYEEKTGDKCLRTYIEIYKDLIDETSSSVYNKNGVLMTEWLDEYFQDINRSINRVYKSLEADCVNNFRWWKQAKKNKNGATALRRQLSGSVMFFNNNNMNYLCRKYLKQDYDFSRLQDKKYNASLIVALDKVMEADGSRKVYTYPSRDKDGNPILCESERRPNAPYYKVEYRQRETKKVNDDSREK